MPSGLLTLVPTRNRVENALELLDVFYSDITTESSSGLLFVVGYEDPRFHEYQTMIPENHLLTFPDRGLVKALNYAALKYTQEYEAIGFMGDDHRPRTTGWDSEYLRALDSLGAGFVYGNDLLDHKGNSGERIPTQVAISSSIIESLGYFGPPGFRHLCVDLAWRDLGSGLRRIKYLEDVIIEHMHPAAGKAELDEGYLWANSDEMVAHDEAEYKRWRECDLPHALNRVATDLGIVL